MISSVHENAFFDNNKRSTAQVENDYSGIIGVKLNCFELVNQSLDNMRSKLMSDVKVWNKKNLISKSEYRHFPTDMMLRALFSDNYFHETNIKTDGEVLDIGCLYTNNLVPFYDRGFKCYGTEVTEEAVQLAKLKSEQNNINAEIVLGFNTALPFESSKFDILLSIATIHYEESIKEVDNALTEMCRVMKNGACAIIQTAAPEHDLFKNSNRIGTHLYQLDKKNDLRHMQKFTFFRKADDFMSIAKRYFTSVEVARVSEHYPNSCVDVWLFKLKK